jgi:hypothetical protein
MRSRCRARSVFEVPRERRRVGNLLFAVGQKSPIHRAQHDRWRLYQCTNALWAYHGMTTPTANALCRANAPSDRIQLLASQTVAPWSVVWLLCVAATLSAPAALCPCRLLESLTLVPEPENSCMIDNPPASDQLTYLHVFCCVAPTEAIDSLLLPSRPRGSSRLRRHV